jgi:membrane protease YdiL (CAAX protease family)
MRSRVWTAIWRITLFLLIWGSVVAAVIIPFLSSRVPTSGPLRPPQQLFIETSSLSAVIFTAAVLRRFVDRQPLTTLGFHSRRAALDLLAGLAFGLAMMTACVIALLAGGWAWWDPNGRFVPSTLALALFTMLLNTVTQEVLVRGFVQRTLQELFTETAAVIVSALIFAGMHAGAIHDRPLPATSLFAAGILLGTARSLTDNLWLPIGIHFGWNALQGPVLGQLVSGQSLSAGRQLVYIAGPTWITGGTFGIEGGVIALTVTFLAAVVLLAGDRVRRWNRH